MQIYKNNLINKRFCNKIICEILDFLKFKVQSDCLTLEEEQAIIGLIESSLPLSATVDDLARYFHQAPGSVRAVIHRKMLSKPTRRVTYRFLDFLRVVPERWVR